MREKFLDWARSQERRGVEIPAIAYRSDGKRLGVLISDLSYDGCQLSVSEDIQPDEKLTIVIFELGTEILATVRWRQGNRHGVRFDEMLKKNAQAFGEAGQP